MKTSNDRRHLERIQRMKQLFAWDFNHDDIGELVTEIIPEINKIDQILETAAPSWPLAKINKIDLAILRLATYELIFQPETPTRVVADEAVEIAKEYGAESSSSFVNGVLGKVITDLASIEES